MSAGRPRGELWVQGARQLDASSRTISSRSPDTWAELLFKRLTGSFLDIESTDATVEAERLLDLDPSVYFYVNAPHPHFGQHVAVFRIAEIVDGRYVQISPFDTGGLALGHIPLKHHLPVRDLRAFVQAASLEPDKYWVYFLTWVRTAFRRFAAYVEAREPSHHYLDEVDLASCTSAQAWFWEARAHKMRSFPMVADVQRVTLGPGDRRRFMEWLGTFGAHGSTEALMIAKKFRRISEESSNPAASATMYLLRKGVRR